MLGERIAFLRGRFGWSQAELARRLHISSSAVGMYEQGRREPSLDVVVTLSRVLGVSVDYLLTGECLCRRDWRARSAISSAQDQVQKSSNAVELFSKEELLVLLAANVLGAGNE